MENGCCMFCIPSLAIIGGIIDGFKSNKKEAQQVTADVENERHKAIKKAQDEDKANVEEEKKKQEKEVAAQPVEKKEESLEDKVKKLTSNEFGKERVESVKVNDNLGTEDPNDKIVLITAESKENVSANYTKKGMWIATISILKDLKNEKNISEMAFFYKYPH